MKVVAVEKGEATEGAAVGVGEADEKGEAASKSFCMRALNLSAMGLWERSQKCVKGKSAWQSRQMKRSRRPRGRRQTTQWRGIARSSSAVPASLREIPESIGSM